MFLERIRPFRLVERGGGGPACDADGVTLGGISLVSLDSDSSATRRFVVRPVDELGDILNTAYGRQEADVVRRCHRGLHRVASALERDDLALAGIEAVMLRLPELDANAMAKLASFADLEKGGDAWRDEPRVPAGQSDGGQWTTGGGGAGAQPAHRTPSRSTPHSGRGGPRPQPIPQRNATEQSRRADPVSTLVDASNAVAGALVEGSKWLEQEATNVPVAPEIAGSEPGFPGAALEETTDPKAFQDWRPVSNLEVGLDALSVVGAVAPAARSVVEGVEAAGAVRFSSYSELKQYLGSAGAGNQWHHVVEQTPNNLRLFGAEAIHSTDNVVAVPKSVHVGKGSISAYYSSKSDLARGLTVRKWLSTQSFGAQRAFGIKTLKRYGQW